MLRRTRVGVLALGGCVGALALPTAAGAATKLVVAGPPPIAKKIAAKYVSIKAFKAYNPDLNAFFNQRTTIHVGDKVSFVLHGFHTVDLPGKSGQDLPLVVPGPTANGFKDAAGNPFWFNGKVPQLGLNPALVSRSKLKTYNGTARIESGLPLSPKTKPLIVRFTKAGTYKYFCDIHPGMVGFVTVRPKGARVPTAKQDLAATVAQVTKQVKTIAKLSKPKLPKNTVSLGRANPLGGELYAMFPGKLSVKVGTTVTFRMSPGTREVHTATFGPASYLKLLAKSLQGSPFFDARAPYPSDPGQPITLGSTSHGNGFANTGLLSIDPPAKLPSSSKITFTTAGTYQYVCLIHPFMQGTIVVTK